MGILDIKLYSYENTLLFECDNIQITPLATGTSRRFTFSNPRWIVFKDATSYTHIEEHDLLHEFVKIEITIANKYGELSLINEFKIHLLDFGDLNEQLWMCSGLIFEDNFREYQQEIIDIFSLWSDNKNVDWLKIPIKSAFKAIYFYCCFLYSGLSSKINEKDYYIIDISLVTDLEDIIYFLSIEFTGHRGYFGHNLYTLEDCLLEVYHNGGFTTTRRMLFSNVQMIQEKQVLLLLNDIRTLLSRFNFVFE